MIFGFQIDGFRFRSNKWWMKQLSSSIARRAKASTKLEQGGEAAFPVLIDALGHPKETVRTCASGIIRTWILDNRLGEAIPLLCKALTATDYHTLSHACGLADEATHRRSVEKDHESVSTTLKPLLAALWKIYKSDAHEHNRADALTAIGDAPFVNPQDYKWCKKALKDRSIEVRRAALKTVAKNVDKGLSFLADDVADCLRGKLTLVSRDQPASESYHAAEALLQMDQTAATQALRQQIRCGNEVADHLLTWATMPERDFDAMVSNLRRRGHDEYSLLLFKHISNWSRNWNRST